MYSKVSSIPNYDDGSWGRGDLCPQLNLRFRAPACPLKTYDMGASDHRNYVVKINSPTNLSILLKHMGLVTQTSENKLSVRGRIG